MKSRALIVITVALLLPLFLGSDAGSRRCSRACDTSEPSTLGGLALTRSTHRSLSFSWSAPSDNVGVAGYDVYLDGAKLGSTTALSYTVSRLACATSHRFGVDAFDAAGNRSVESTATRSTAACPRTTWVKVASEGYPFSLPTTSAVRYGSGSAWTQLTRPAGGYVCGDALFGDPAPGTVKECEVPSNSLAAHMWRGDYETGDFSQWWLQEWSQGSTQGFSTSEVGNSTATIVSSPVAQGRYAAKFQVFPSTGSSPLDRAEIVATQAASGGYPNQEWYYGWSSYFPGPGQSWWSEGRAWNDITQFFSTDNTASQLYLGIDATGSAPVIYVEGMPIGHRRLSGPLRYDHWYHFIVRVRWSVDPSVGFVEIWLDGKKVVPLTYGETLRNQSSPASPAVTAPGMYISQGIYRRASPFTNTVIHDGLCRADSYAAASSCSSAARASRQGRRRRQATTR